MQIKAASKQAGVATASMGKFDARLPGEKPGERSMGPKRKDVGPVAAAPGQEGKKVLFWPRNIRLTLFILRLGRGPLGSST